MQEQDTLSKYGQSFQSKVVSALLVDSKMMDTLNEIIHTKFFESEANKWIVEEIKDYYNQYKSSPTLDVFKVQLEKLENPPLKKQVVEQLRTVYTQVGKEDLQYVKDEFSAFCINQNIKNAIVQSVDLLKNGNYDRIKQLVDAAMKVGVETDLGHEYVEDYIKRTEEIDRNTVPTSWECINELMDGGLGPGELGVVVAPSGVGKTWVLCALGAAAVKMGKSVVHYTLELSEKYVGQRYDTVFTGVPSADLKDNKDEVFEKIQKLRGKLLIKYFPHTSYEVVVFQQVLHQRILFV